jgi:hypothetical protein
MDIENQLQDPPPGRTVLYIALAGYVLELLNEYRRIQAQVEEYTVRGPPAGCYGTPVVPSWFFSSSFSASDCDEYVRVISQSIVPNPFRIFMYCFSDTFILPLQRFWTVLGGSAVVVVVCLLVLLLLRVRSLPSPELQPWQKLAKIC